MAREPLRVGILAVGTELLGIDRLDTNSLRLTAILRRHGAELKCKVVVGDQEGDIAVAVAGLLARVDLIVVSGGLGPTADDVTREAVARALGRALSLDERVLGEIAARFARLGMRMPEVNRRQAQVIDGAAVLANPRGSAPGMRLEHAGRTLFLLPGVPAELVAMAEEHLVPWLAGHGGTGAIESLTLKVACLAESQVEERIAPAYAEFPRRDITVLAGAGEVRVVLTASGGESERRARLAAMAQRMRGLLGAALFAEADDVGLEHVLGDLLQAAGLTAAAAESCTGGLVAERLTRVAGSSRSFLGGVVAYSDQLKERLLEVPAALLAEHGAVSEPVARAMAEGLRRVAGSDLAIAVTGIAGPGGGSEHKPVGTVHVALAGPGEAVEHRLLRLPGDRLRVRQLASQWALEMMRRRLLSDPLGAGR